jgi:hypothetical protein
MNNVNVKFLLVLAQFLLFVDSGGDLVVLLLHKEEVALCKRLMK